MPSPNKQKTFPSSRGVTILNLIAIRIISILYEGENFPLPERLPEKAKGEKGTENGKTEGKEWINTEKGKKREKGEKRKTAENSENTRKFCYFLEFFIAVLKTFFSTRNLKEILLNPTKQSNGKGEFQEIHSN